MLSLTGRLVAFRQFRQALALALGPGAIGHFPRARNLARDRHAASLGSHCPGRPCQLSALNATIGWSPMKAANARTTSESGLPSRSIADWVMPVSSVTRPGIAVEDLTRERNESRTVESRLTRSAPISMISCLSGSGPVVSTAKTRKVSGRWSTSIRFLSRYATSAAIKTASAIQIIANSNESDVTVQEFRYGRRPSATISPGEERHYRRRQTGPSWSRLAVLSTFSVIETSASA